MIWKIKKPLGRCVECQRSFLDGEAYYSFLRITEEELFREDRCLDCWKKVEPSDDRVYWKTRHFISPQQKKRINFEGLREVFLQLCEKRDPAQEPIHYLVVLLLVRKRILKIRELRRGDQGELLIVGFSRSGENYEIPVPELLPEKLESLKSDLEALFENSVHSA